jgi:hypothetical protein
MYGWNELKKQNVITKTTVECPVKNCNCNVSRMSKSGVNLSSDKLKLTNYQCPKHKIYISPSTWEYSNVGENLLWYETNDKQLLSKILQNGVKRESRMERDNSEDALTWNVFRYLEDRTNLLDSFFSFFIGNIQNQSKLIYWSYCQSVNDVYPLLNRARLKFGEKIHQGSEPDIMCETEESLIFVEAKLTAGNNTSGYGKDLDRHLKNPKEYVIGENNWFTKVFRGDYQTVVNNQKYELMRFWILGTWMAKELNKDFYLINLVPMDKELNIEFEFKPLIIENQTTKFLRLSWEDIYCFCKIQKRLKDWQKFSNYFLNKTIGYKSNELKKAFFNNI